MPGNMADIVHIPVEAANVAEQTTSIYNVRTYVGCADRIVFRVALRRRPSRQFVRPRPFTRFVPNGRDVNRLARVIALEDNQLHVGPISVKQMPKPRGFPAPEDNDAAFFREYIWPVRGD
jgi:hypothetical protein